MLPSITYKLARVQGSIAAGVPSTTRLDLFTTKDVNTRYNVFNFKDIRTNAPIENFMVTEQPYGFSVIQLVKKTTLPDKQRPIFILGILFEGHIVEVNRLKNDDY